MSKMLTAEYMRGNVALLAAVKQILEDADEVELYTQLAELHESMDRAVQNPDTLKGASVRQASAADTDRLIEVYSQLDALAKEPSNSVQFLCLCKHLREALLELGIGQRKKKKTAARRLRRAWRACKRITGHRGPRRGSDRISEGTPRFDA